MMVRAEGPEDLAGIRMVVEHSFGQRNEADLVEELRREQAVLASFVADLEGQIVGHILFSRMWIDRAAEAPVPAVALAPVAVLPERQGRGVGETLIRHGLEWMKGQGEQVVIALGHPGYYARFGFSTERARELLSPFPPEAFMALELKPRALDGVRGRVRYAAAFGL